MRIVLAGIIARYPFGGVTWCSLMYLLGLRKLGHEVYYLEDTGECIYDPVKNEISLDSSFGLKYIHKSLAQYGLGENWCFVDYAAQHFGKTRAELKEICATADLFINLSGGCWFWRDEYQRIPRKVFIDSDPAFTQMALAKREQWYVDFFAGFDALFTFGRNIGADDCTIPATPFAWKTTWQPVTCDDWATNETPRDVFSTVMTWRNESFTDADGNKDKQFVHFMDLPQRTPQPLELAVNGPQDLLRAHGWRTVDGMAVSDNLNKYRSYLQSAKAEFSVAKHAYVATRSGWFSDRSECYLAAGRPVVVQETGFGKYLPTGEGLLSFNNLDEAVEAIGRVNAAYAAHSRRAQEIARAYFDARVVLPKLLAEAGVA